jgi:hypothetical protein
MFREMTDFNDVAKLQEHTADVVPVLENKVNSIGT